MTSKKIEAAIKLLEAAGYDVIEREDADWEEAALAYREAYLAKLDEAGGRHNFLVHPLDKSLPRIIAGLKAARPLLPDDEE